MNGSTMQYYHEQLVYWAPKILIALVILIVTWVVARTVKWLFQKASDRVAALRDRSGPSKDSVGAQLGNVAKLIIWLVGITAALQFLGMGQILAPVNALTSGIFVFLPRLIGACLIFFIGFVVARIVRELVETVVGAANFEPLLSKAGLADISDSTSAAGGRSGIARAAGIVIFALIIIPVSIAALQVLGIDSISAPAVNMLNQIMAAIPHILSAGLWLGIAFLAATFLRSMIEAVLPPMGFDRAVQSTGLFPDSTAPSRIAGNITFLAIMLGAGIEAARQLGGATVAQFLAEMTELGGMVLFGTLIIVAGALMARVIARLIGNASDDGGFAQGIVRYAVIALSAAIGLRFMGLANEIVILAFGLVLGSAALALGLAFGLGGRAPAEKLLDVYASRLAHDAESMRSRRPSVSVDDQPS